MNVHTICLISRTTFIICWLFIYFEIFSSSFFQVALVDHMVRIRYAAPVDPVMGASSPENTTIDIRAYRLFTNNWYEQGRREDVCDQV